MAKLAQRPIAAVAGATPIAAAATAAVAAAAPIPAARAVLAGAALILAAATAALGPAAAQTATVREPTIAGLRGDDAEKPAVALQEVPLFERAILERLRRTALAQARAGDVVAAELTLRRLLAGQPELSNMRLLLAQLLTARGALEEAVEELRRASQAGFREPNLLIAADVFAPLRDREDFKTLVSAMRKAPRRKPPRL
ncbi:MAG: hypothetical protein AAF192_22625, partial [Pseudomonadota bacterium]